jgi:spermidine/putrescine transport system substrate-binding protein
MRLDGVRTDPTDGEKIMPAASIFRTTTLPLASRREFLKRSAAGLALAASGASAFSSRAMAKTPINWLGWQGYDSPLKTEGFLETNGIELAATYLGSNDEIFIQLSANAPLDIVTPYMGYVPSLREAGLIQPIDPAKVPNLAKVMPLLRYDANLFANRAQWGVPFTWGAGPMVYDPAAVQPTSWFDIEKPEYKGKIAMMDDSLCMMLTVSLMVSGAKTASLLTHAQLAEVKKYCIKIKNEHARSPIFVSYADAVEAMVRGEVVMTLGGAEWLPTIAAGRKQLAYLYPKEGCFAFIDSYAIPKSTPNPDLAHAMANHMLTLPAQLDLTKSNYAVATDEAVKALTGPAASMYPYGDMTTFRKLNHFLPMAPGKDMGEIAGWPKWLAAWQEVLAAA